jgi:hypothetical protein
VIKAWSATKATAVLSKSKEAATSSSMKKQVKADERYDKVEE